MFYFLFKKTFFEYELSLTWELHLKKNRPQVSETNMCQIFEQHNLLFSILGNRMNNTTNIVLKASIATNNAR